MPHFLARLSASASSHRNLSSAVFITNIAESDFSVHTAIILAWANTQPRDPRVPEALHLVVRATRYGQKHTETSKAAYLLLHNRYCRNPWTSKTPLWFSSPGDE
jgi:hypothetical protein